MRTGRRGGGRPLTLDDIPPLDERLVDADIVTLTTECDLLVDGADAGADNNDPDGYTGDGVDAYIREGTALDSRTRGTPHAEDYALAAGAATTPPDALTLARGTGGWDWRRCPPGLIDASERALSWEIRRRPGATTIHISAVAAPGLRVAIPPHLRPRAEVRTPTATAAAELTLAGDAWTGTLPAPGGWESTVTVEIHVPGVGPSAAPDDPQLRSRLRDFATSRLRAATQAPDDTMLLAEKAAANTDMDF